MIKGKWSLGIKYRGHKRRFSGVGINPSHLVPEAEQGRGKPGLEYLGRLQLQLLQEKRKRKEYWRLGL